METGRVGGGIQVQGQLLHGKYDCCVRATANAKETKSAVLLSISHFL